MDINEPLEIVNERGEVIGLALRSEIHSNPSLMHRVVHVLIFNKAGELLLQKRSLNKDVAPGRWDTSVGGHVGVAEDLLSAARRETEEELGLTDCDLQYLYSYIHCNSSETELVASYRCIYEDPIGGIFFNRREIDEIRFWSFHEINLAVGKQILSPHCEIEYVNYVRFLDTYRCERRNSS
ncbi:MAG TPA: NUDIX domain-containing protein [Thermodesulfovibrionales bacterium]|nr:NUDIX domain-containing protein [Thermodesulfovibrionales bacterium]